MIISLNGGATRDITDMLTLEIFRYTTRNNKFLKYANTFVPLKTDFCVHFAFFVY